MDSSPMGIPRALLHKVKHRVGLEEPWRHTRFHFSTCRGSLRESPEFRWSDPV